jgi:hypothetical protein
LLYLARIKNIFRAILKVYYNFHKFSDRFYKNYGFETKNTDTWYGRQVFWGIYGHLVVLSFAWTRYVQTFEYTDCPQGQTGHSGNVTLVARTFTISLTKCQKGQKGAFWRNFRVFFEFFVCNGVKRPQSPFPVPLQIFFEKNCCSWFFYFLNFAQ